MARLNNNYYWENDTWADIVHENGEVFDTNLWTCDRSGRQYISFYETFNDENRFRKTDGVEPVATFRVVEEVA